MTDDFINKHNPLLASMLHLLHLKNKFKAISHPADDLNNN